MIFKTETLKEKESRIKDEWIKVCAEIREQNAEKRRKEWTIKYIGKCFKNANGRYIKMVSIDKNADYIFKIDVYDYPGEYQSTGIIKCFSDPENNNEFQNLQEISEQDFEAYYTQVKEKL